VKTNDAGNTGTAGAGVDEDLLRRELTLRPTEPELLGRLGRLLAEDGRDAEAFDLLQRAAQANPGRPELLLPLAALLVKNGRPEEAIEFAEAAAVSGPSHAAAALLVVGDAYRSKGEGEAALEAYREAARRAPDEPALRDRLEAAEKNLLAP
jgi:tetratricopeptide (TPR) repeat protein